MEKPENNTKLILTFAISIILLIVVVAVGTFSFYTNRLNKQNEENSKTNINTSKLDFQIIDSTLKGSNLIPGDTITKTFKIKNNGNVEGNYSIIWKSVANSFVNKQDLIVTLKEDEDLIIPESQNLVFPNSTTTPVVIKNNLKIAPGATKNYTLTITYQNTQNDQTADMGKSISAVIDMLV